MTHLRTEAVPRCHSSPSANRALDRTPAHHPRCRHLLRRHTVKATASWHRSHIRRRESAADDPSRGYKSLRQNSRLSFFDQRATNAPALPDKESGKCAPSFLLEARCSIYLLLTMIGLTDVSLLFFTKWHCRPVATIIAT